MFPDLPHIEISRSGYVQRDKHPTSYVQSFSQGEIPRLQKYVSFLVDDRTAFRRYQKGPECIIGPMQCLE